MNSCVAITGCAGFVGFHLALRLLDEGISVIGCDNLNNYYSQDLKGNRLKILLENTNFKFSELDIANSVSLTSQWMEHNPSIVIHLAAQAGVRHAVDHPEDYMHFNVVGTGSVFECAQRLGVEHVLFASSSSVYGLNNKVPFSESDPIDHPASLYAATKRSCELIAHSYSHVHGLPITGIRFFSVYGPYGRPDMAYFSFSQAICSGKTITVFDNGKLARDYTYIDDIIEAIFRLMKHPPRPQLEAKLGVNSFQAPLRFVNVGSDCPITINEMIVHLEENFNRKAIIRYATKRPDEVDITMADTRYLQSVTGFVPQVPFAVGINKFCDWFKRSSFYLP